MYKGFLILLLVTVLITSCATSRFTEDEARSVLQTTFTSAVESQSFSLRSSEKSDSFLYPQQAKSLLDNKALIPGLGTKLKTYESYALAIIDVALKDINQEVLALMAQVELKDPKSLVLSSSSSMTELFKTSCYSELLLWASKQLSQMSLDRSFQEALEIYNYYMGLRGYVYNSKTEALDIDICSLVADSVLAIYIQDLAKAESFIRTTPAVTNDSVMRRVFGLKLR